jgi:C_GCAxxG_C_C family probable redox protein
MNKIPSQPNKDLIEKIGILASEYEMKYHGCAQCVLAALQEGFGIVDVLTFKAATGLSGGIARMGETCSALVGGILAIGMIFGRKSLEEASKSEEYQKTMHISSILIHEFNKEFGSTKCKDIQTKLFRRHFNLNDPEQRKEFALSGAYSQHGCPSVVKKAATLTAKVILDNLNK